MAIGFKKIRIRIDGRELKEIPAGFRSMEFSQSVGKHHSLSLEFRWDALETGTSLLTHSADYIGKEIDLTVIFEESEILKKEEELRFKGIVECIHSSRKNDVSGDSIVISAISPDVVLSANHHSKSFIDKTPDAIVNEIFNDHSLVCDTKVSTAGDNSKRPYTVQYNETSFNFLSRFACSSGQWFYYNGTQLIFGELNREETVELQYGKNLFNFGLQVNIEPFSFGYVAYNYTDTNQQIYKSDDSGKNVKISQTGKIAAKNSETLFTHQTLLLYNQNLTTGKEQKNLDHKILVKKTAKSSKMVFCTGETDCSLLKIGGGIKIKEKSGGSFVDHGNYTVIDLQHEVKRNGEYSNRFIAIPEECKIAFIPAPESPVCDTQSAVVTDNEDPENMGRIRVRFFWQKEDEMSPWLRIVNPYAGHEKGHLFLPEIDEEVIVDFKSGNPEDPYVLGAFYHAKAFPETWSPKNNDIKAIRTRSGHTIEFHDTEGEEEVWLYDYNKENYFIKLKTHAKEITIEAIEHIELKAKNISILAEKDLKLEATDATTKAGGNISTEASGNISSKASGNMSNEASANMKIKGGANTTIEAGAKLEEKAAIVKLN